VNSEDHVVIGGAKSSELQPRYDQIPSVFLRRLAERFTLGNEKFDPPTADIIGGTMNWQGGDAIFFRERFNHVIEHLMNWKADYENGEIHTDDDLIAAAWGLAVLVWAEHQNVINPMQQRFVRAVDDAYLAQIEADREQLAANIEKMLEEEPEPSTMDKVKQFFGL
jgi:hypothetical protein